MKCDSRLVKLGDEIIERGARDRAFLGEVVRGLRIDIVGDALMTLADQTTHHVGTHTS